MLDELQDLLVGQRVVFDAAQLRESALLCGLPDEARLLVRFDPLWVCFAPRAHCLALSHFINVRHFPSLEFRLEKNHRRRKRGGGYWLDFVLVFSYCRLDFGLDFFPLVDTETPYC